MYRITLLIAYFIIMYIVTYIWPSIYLSVSVYLHTYCKILKRHTRRIPDNVLIVLINRKEESGVKEVTLYLQCFNFPKKKKKIPERIWKSVNTYFSGGLYIGFLYYTSCFSVCVFPPKKIKERKINKKKT